jgi:hypothetical protein
LEGLETEKEFIECPECNGKGWNEEMNCMSGSAAQCCASCFKRIKCERCGGSREIENENYIEKT